MLTCTKIVVITLLSLIGAASFPAHSAQNQIVTPIKKLTLAFPVGEETLLGQWVHLIYSEAFRRLDMEFEFKALPGKRASIMADQGQVDGEFIRVYSYLSDHPNLLRVEEAVLSIRFSAFATDTKIRLHGWNDLLGTDYRVEYMRGIRRCEEKLPEVVRADNLTVTDNHIQGLKRLMLNRTDIYVNSELYVQATLDNEIFAHAIFNAGLLEDVPHYLYLHKKHSELVPKFTAVLSAMKNEGLIEKYRSSLVEK